MSILSNQKGKLCENTPLVNNIFLSPYFPSHFNLLPLSKVSPPFLLPPLPFTPTLLCVRTQALKHAVLYQGIECGHYYFYFLS